MRSQAELIATWGQLGRLLTQMSQRAPDWQPVTNMLGAAVPHFQARAAALNDLLNDSDHLLRPLGDPLRLDFGAHRWLKGDREEAYSDWLAWIVENLDAPAILELFSIGRLYPKAADLRNALAKVRPTVKREACVPEGHCGKQGRLDLVVRFAELAVLVVEIKVTQADQADTAKQEGYEKWLSRQKGERWSVLLATGGEAAEYSGKFILLKWADLCLSLRHLTRELAAAGRLTMGALVLAFVGAAEQNLLQMSTKAVEQFVHGRSATFDETVVSHLESWTKDANRIAVIDAGP